MSSQKMILPKVHTQIMTDKPEMSYTTITQYGEVVEYIFMAN